MKASLRSARIAPKKANIIAKMVRGMPVLEAIAALERTQKKGARFLEDLLRSAVANAKNNDGQDPSVLVVKTVVVNQAAGLRRGVPMARGRVRPMRKFMSHVDVVLGIEGETDGRKEATKKLTKKAEKSTKRGDATKEPVAKVPSQKVKRPAQSAKSGKKPS